jgi:CDGSH-type Zn-finger protein/uncharacterized Fe-S cluster protein YjdI
MPPRTYTADGIEVRYDPVRCIHFAACVHGLPAVFDKGRRPWIDPAQGAPDAVAEVVVRCPTGALHYARTDGGAEEAVPPTNTVRVAPDGPLYVHGDVWLETPAGEVVLHDTRVALCRCGRSHHKPFCDNSHLAPAEGEPAGAAGGDAGGAAGGAAFADPAALGTHNATAPEAPGGPLRILLRADGPLFVQGPVTITGAGGAEVATAKASLCRCGASANKPFCDGSHRRIGFSTAPEGRPPAPPPTPPA